MSPPGNTVVNVFANPPRAAVEALLAAGGLPVDDLAQQDLGHFFGCGEADRPCGVVGLEVHGTVALLRSLAVAEEARGHGCAKRLVATAEAHARALEIAEIYALTLTARRLFEALGYRMIDRGVAPAAIRATREFSSLCPDSATLLVKTLAPAPEHVA